MSVINLGTGKVMTIPRGTSLTTRRNRKTGKEEYVYEGLPGYEELADRCNQQLYGNSKHSGGHPKISRAMIEQWVEDYKKNNEKKESEDVSWSHRLIVATILAIIFGILVQTGCFENAIEWVNLKTGLFAKYTKNDTRGI